MTPKPQGPFETSNASRYENDEIIEALLSEDSMTDAEIADSPWLSAPIDLPFGGD